MYATCGQSFQISVVPSLVLQWINNYTLSVCRALLHHTSGICSSGPTEGTLLRLCETQTDYQER